jgi:hypothetical protein
MSSRRRFLSSTVAVAGSAGLPPAAEAAAPISFLQRNHAMRLRPQNI